MGNATSIPWKVLAEAERIAEAPQEHHNGMVIAALVKAYAEARLEILRLSADLRAEVDMRFRAPDAELARLAAAYHKRVLEKDWFVTAEGERRAYVSASHLIDYLVAKGIVPVPEAPPHG